VAFLQGVLRFPQRFWMVFCGEVVVVLWWKRGSYVDGFWAGFFSSVLRFIFGSGLWKCKGNDKSKGNNLSLRPSGFAPAFGRAVAPSA
jgi:hypothetical protein